MTEIILLGTFHFPDRYDIFSEQVQDELERFVNRLSELRPTKLAVEMAACEQSRLQEFYRRFEPSHLTSEYRFGELVRYGSKIGFTSLNEIVQVGFRLARKLRHDTVYAVDEDIVLSDELLETCSEALSEPSEKFNRFFQAATADREMMLEDMYRLHNDKQYASLDHNMYLHLNRVNKGSYEGSRLVLAWYERNLKIFSNIQNLCEPGDRILLIIGSSHKRILENLVRDYSEMRLLEI
ncbi:MAG: DUF5694 domain-containing protein [Lachnospiraceae bacterium]|nr:DUF5694 domain-containing protein [Lachnospiraceae bacterium]